MLKNEPIYSYIEKIMENTQKNILNFSNESFNEWLSSINRDYYYLFEFISLKIKWKPFWIIKINLNII